MFELKKAIENWQSDLLRGGTITPEDLAELEEHLHESMMELQEKDLNEQEAFLVSTSRLGSPAVLRREFAKTNGIPVGRRLLFWAPWVYLIWMASSRLVPGILMLFQALSPAGRVQLALGTVCWMAILYLLIRNRKRDEARHGREVATFRRVAYIIATILLGHVCFVVANFLQSARPFEYGKSALLAGAGELPFNLLVITICVAVIYLMDETRVRDTEDGLTQVTE